MGVACLRKGKGARGKRFRIGEVESSWEMFSSGMVTATNQANSSSHPNPIPQTPILLVHLTLLPKPITPK